MTSEKTRVPDPPRDQLGVLRTEIDHQHRSSRRCMSIDVSRFGHGREFSGYQ